MTTTSTGRTITIEEIGNVPELAHVQRLVNDYDLKVIERLDGEFVRNHGDMSHLRNSNHIWDNARHLADRIDARYIGPGRPEIRSAQQVQAGWYVLVGAPCRESWRRVKAVSEVVNLAKLRETGQPRPTIRIEFDHRLPITVTPDEQLDCRWMVGS